MSLTTLPEECLLNIFSYLPGKDWPRARQVCKQFNQVLDNGWRFLKKPAMAEITISYEGNSVAGPFLSAEVRFDGHEEMKMEMTSTEIKVEQTYTDELSEQLSKNMMKNSHYFKRSQKLEVLRAFFAKGIGCDNFGPRHPISIQSIEAGLDIILHTIMKYCNLSRLALRGEGYWMPEKFQNVLRVLRDSRATVKELQFETDQITDSMAELIRFSKCQAIVFTGPFERTDFDRGQNSVDGRIREFYPEELTFYPTDLVSVKTLLYLLQTFVVSRADEKELEISYYTYHDSSYMEVKKHWSRSEIAELERQRKEEEAPKQEGVQDLEDDLMGFGLFD